MGHATNALDRDKMPVLKKFFLPLLTCQFFVVYHSERFSGTVALQIPNINHKRRAFTRYATPAVTSATRGGETSMPPNNLEAMPNNIILFDGVCNFCNTWVDILLRIDRRKQFKFAPLQSDVGKKLLASIGKEADDISSVLLIKSDLTFYDKSRCVIKVVEELGPFAGTFSGMVEKTVPARLRDGIYDTVAENRYNFLGKRTECRCSDPSFADRFVQ